MLTDFVRSIGIFVPVDRTCKYSTFLQSFSRNKLLIPNLLDRILIANWNSNSNILLLLTHHSPSIQLKKKTIHTSLSRTHSSTILCMVNFHQNSKRWANKLLWIVTFNIYMYNVWRFLRFRIFDRSSNFNNNAMREIENGK